jgi:hypothetical protein
MPPHPHLIGRLQLFGLHLQLFLRTAQLQARGAVTVQLDSGSRARPALWQSGRMREKAQSAPGGS